MLSPENSDRDAQISAAEMQLKSFGRFLDGHDNRLYRLSTRLGSTETQFFDSTFDRVTPAACSQFPVTVKYSDPAEVVSPFQIIDSDNKVLNKILITFVQLCDEAHVLKAESRSFQTKLLYFDEDLQACEESGQTDECFVKMSNLLELLCAIQYLTERCIMLASTILQQLGALFSCSELAAAGNNLDLQLAMQFQEIFNRLGDIIVQLIIFDEILSSSNFLRFWHGYKKTIYSIGKNLDQFRSHHVDLEMNGLTNVLNCMEILFAGHLFQSFLDSTFKMKEQIATEVHGSMAGHLHDYIKANLTSIEKFSCANGSTISEFDETELIIKMNAMCVLYHSFFGQLDHKMFKNLIDLNAKHVGITLVGNITWRPEIFLQQHAGTLMKKYDKCLMESIRVRQAYLQAKIQTLAADTKQCCALIAQWSFEMSVNLKIESHTFRVAHFKNLCNIFLRGLKYAGQLAHMIKSLTNLHVLLHTTMTRNTLLSICKLIECLKIVHVTFQSEFVDISKAIQCVTQYLAYKILFVIATIKKKLSTQGGSCSNERVLDMLSALQIAEKCMHGPVTKSRILIATLALNAANPVRLFSAEYLEKLHKIIHRIELLIDLQANVERLCDTSFTYWHQSIVTVYLKQLIERQPFEYNSIKYLIRSADSCSRTLDRIGTDLRVFRNFRQANYERYCQHIVEKLCAQIETFLRIEVHANWGGGSQAKSSPLGEQRVQDLRALIDICPIEVNACHVVLKDHVENYLSTMFYNLTTISLHDWKTYGEMRHLGNYKFNIVTIEDHLPTQTLEQGIDVLEIMRNIQVFVSKYLYSMNNQIFVETASNNKHLNTIGIKHIANSLRTHGMGVINTTVNFTYQFLRKKFYSFSQFMYDEHIKSRLMKDLKYFRDNKERLGQMYSYERADSFNKGIRRFGLTGDGQSYLDLFRQLISHIGNAMGYIRLIRSGGIHASSTISAYLPKFDENMQFATGAMGDGLCETSVCAAENFENTIRNVSRNFSGGTEYFQLLVEAFAPFFRDPKNIHLRNFYLIVPPLTINFVEYIINAKDKIPKKDKRGVLFVDDGFAIGLAYILKLLDQMTEFNSLHWFKAVKNKYTMERTKISEQRDQVAAAGSSGDDKLQQTLALTEKRINAYQMEFNLLYYNLTSSKIFFQ